MATPADVAELLAATRSGSVLDRGRAAAAAFRALSQLDADEKRELAVLVAEKAAPHLVPRIQEEAGVDLSREQVQAVLDMARNLDDEDIEELRRTVRDPDARAEALRRVGTAAAGSAAASAGLSDEEPTAEPVDVPPPPVADTRMDEHPAPPNDDESGTQAEQHAEQEAEREAARARERAEAEAEEALERAREELAALETEGTDVDLADDWEPPETHEVAPEAYEPVFDTIDAPPEPVTTPSPAERANTPAPEPEAATPDETDLATKVAVQRAPLVERLRAADGNGRRLAVLARAFDDVRTMDTPHRRAVIEALPDGWARRRGLQRLLENDAVPADEVPALLLLLERPMARAWIAATAVESGYLSVEQLPELLDARSADRLARRYAGTAEGSI